jgi:hypothetical protein
MIRSELTHALKTATFDQASNIKFYKILWSRLTELDIPSDDATKIASVVEYDFSNVPEDNDSLSEFATEYAEYAEKVYKSIKLNGIRDITPLLRYFHLFKLEITGL